MTIMLARCDQLINSNAEANWNPARKLSVNLANRAAARELAASENAETFFGVSIKLYDLDNLNYISLLAAH